MNDLSIDLAALDFALDELPGDAMHHALRAFRELGPVQKTQFLGIPCFVIAKHTELGQPFTDNELFPGHLMYASSFAPAIGESFISESDPLKHLQYRKLATPAFRSRAIASYEREGLSILANELVDSLAERDEFDLIQDFTSGFPYLVISRMLGLPRDREAEFHGWALALLSFRNDAARALEARETFSEFLAPIVENRRREPQNAAVASPKTRRLINDFVGHELANPSLGKPQEFSEDVIVVLPDGGAGTHFDVAPARFDIGAVNGLLEAQRVSDLDERFTGDVLRITQQTRHVQNGGRRDAVALQQLGELAIHEAGCPVREMRV